MKWYEKACESLREDFGVRVKHEGVRKALDEGSVEAALDLAQRQPDALFDLEGLQIRVGGFALSYAMIRPVQSTRGMRLLFRALAAEVLAAAAADRDGV